MDFQQLLGQVDDLLGPQVRQMVSDKFGVDEAAAGQVLPQVASNTMFALKEAAENPVENASVLLRLKDLLDGSNDAQRSDNLGGLAQLVPQLLGDRLGPLVSGLSGLLGKDEGTTKTIILSVVPMVLNFINGRDDQSPLETIFSVLGADQGILGTLGGLLGGSSEGGGLGGLLGGLGKKGGGLFGG